MKNKKNQEHQRQIREGKRDLKLVITHDIDPLSTLQKKYTNSPNFSQRAGI